MTLRSVYAGFVRAIERRRLEVFADIVLLVASTYLLAKRLYGVSISDWLSQNVFLQTPVTSKFVTGYIFFVAFCLVAAVVMKILCLFAKAFPPHKIVATEPERIAACIKVINNEVGSHIDQCDLPQPLTVDLLTSNHRFDVNVRLVVDSLAEHIRNTIDKRLKRRDIFISVYTFDRESNALTYELHYDERSDLVQTKHLPLSDPKFNTYECVKCLNSSSSTCYVTSAKEYTKGNAKRHRTVKQYMGSKLEHNGVVYGFLSIEFHNEAPFSEEREMHVFMEDHVFPFRLLLEYQYLKARFFSRFAQVTPQSKAG